MSSAGEENDQRKVPHWSRNTLIGNLQSGKQGDLFERLIKIYVDVIFNYEKYPPHVQHLHILGKERGNEQYSTTAVHGAGRSLLMDKVLNVRSSKSHKNKLLHCEENRPSENMNEYLVRLNEAAMRNEKLSEHEKKDVIQKVKNIFNHKNVLYALFTLEHNRILFNFSEQLFLKHMEICFLNSAVSNSMDIYRYIRRFGVDSICLYLFEYADHVHILKKRHEIIKGLYLGRAS
ncbi:hypothetical protein AK88_04480 [Plasmodium fragile]|uniref:Uncharacterized protein n=1 Tax=Plasmodium fragile TaxID=5857 RepID=A0A0D9QFX9_PLAFR|nr:uncharacterized protein AK88_04480 [Plasmodium fragile]KJP85893.1 hypothetical protein AK88_04480 [Plasmodium fragile]